MKRIWIVLTLCIVILAACAPSADAINTAIAQTQAANPTATFRPSNTPTITRSPTSTKTPTPSKTPTKTPTLTPPPATQTALVLISAATRKSGNATSTKVAAIAYSTMTARAKSARATEIAKYVKINAKELVTYPDSHTGEMVVIRGRIFNINSNEEFQIWIDGASHEAVYVVMAQPYDDLFENNYVTIYGLVAGENCGTNSFGAEICQPLIAGVFYEKK